MLKLSNTTSTQELFGYDCITLKNRVGNVVYYRTRPDKHGRVVLVQGDQENMGALYRALKGHKSLIKG